MNHKDLIAEEYRRINAMPVLSSLEEMMEKLGLSFSQLSSTLSMMEINGILGKRTDGKFEIK